MVKSEFTIKNKRIDCNTPSFTENQIQATNFKDIAIELWVVKRSKGCMKNSRLLYSSYQNSYFSAK